LDQIPTNAPADPWVPITARLLVTPIAYYDPTTHRIRVHRRWHGRKVWGENTLPPPNPSGDPEVWVKVFADDAWMLLCEYNPVLHRIRRRIRVHGDPWEPRANLPARRTEIVRTAQEAANDDTDQVRTPDG
jgi:hypothetical protein